eukprot:5434808-Amphidinium_carterae.1
MPWENDHTKTRSIAFTFNRTTGLSTAPCPRPSRRQLARAENPGCHDAPTRTQEHPTELTHGQEQARKITDYRDDAFATSGLGNSNDPFAAECFLPAKDLQQTDTVTGIMPRTRILDTQ